MLIGDFNNVIKIEDMIGGNMVTEKEVIDLVNLMSNTELYEMESNGDCFTWSNRQGENAIYSRIDRILGNAEWMQHHIHSTLTNMTPNASDHAILVLRNQKQNYVRIHHFKFINCTAELDTFQETVRNSWTTPLNGRPMLVVWKKLLRLQPLIKKLSKLLLI